jgi:hypothetical protein
MEWKFHRPTTLSLPLEGRSLASVVLLVSCVQYKRLALECAGLSLIVILVFWCTVVVARLVEALCHKMEDSGFGSQCDPWTFSSDLFLLSAFSSSGAHSVSNTVEYQGGLREEAIAILE